MVFTITDSITITSDQTREEKSVIWKQLLLAFLASLPFFTHGVETTELSASVHSGHFISSTSSEVPWSSTALILAAVISAPLYCYLMDNFGRRSGVYLVNLAQGASCIPLFLPETEVWIIILHILAGISTAGLFTVLPAYVREISDDRTRGVTLSLMMTMNTLGYLVYMVADLEAMMFVMVAVVAIQFLSMLVMAETPSYLIMAGKTEAAKTSIAKLKCVGADDSIVSKEVKLISEEMERVKSNGKLKLWKILRNPLYRDITKIGLVLNTTVVLSGSIVFLDQDKTLVQLKMSLDNEKSLVLGCLALGSLVTLCAVKLLDRKYLLTIAYTAMVLSMGVLAVYTQEDLTVVSLRWVPVVALGILVFGYGVMWGLPVVVMAEMLNTQIRARILTLVFIYSQLVKLTHVHTFQFVELHMGIYTVLYVFACINMFGGVYTMFIVPNVKDKTVKQIERLMKRVPLLKFNTIKA